MPPETGIGLTWMPDTGSQGHCRMYHNGKSIGYNARLLLYPKTDVDVVLLVNESASQEHITELEEQLTLYLPQPMVVGRKSSGNVANP